ncbi:hypothetical protein HELRODRAFT_166065 [Helobdella robusta]|uniref:Fibronectin type-III domain-containing protein n=1 Tax=Helobdella robusta TaxID=6412 RepID=T1EXP2_HELRO|nr:hypothetical protein HELRODRAFT_166065 [Helobdella robusta]ESN90400.1 hypothetical protein HELRODRAFT_166065 [Helobdella robusta]
MESANTPTELSAGVLEDDRLKITDLYPIILVPMSLNAHKGTLNSSSPPKKLKVNLHNETSVLVTWEPPEKPNGIIKNYKVYYDLWNNSTFHKSFNWKFVSTSASTHSTVLHHLLANSTYIIKILASNSLGDGLLSDSVKIFVGSKTG